MWSSISSNRQINYGVSPEMGMFVVASTPYHQQQQDAAAAATVNFDPNSINASNAAAAATALGVGVGVGVFPLLTATNVGVDEDLLNNRSRTGAIHQFWQNQPPPHNLNIFKKPAILDHSGTSNLLQDGGGIKGGGGNGGGIIGSSASTSTATCQDCGNQAKKDCSHRRCRTCCKSRNLDCSTHVKSTWVPAARRRERQLIGSATAGGGSTQSISSSKKPKLSSQTSHTSTSNTTPPRSFDTGSSHQEGSLKETLPGQVRAPAVFKCVRVTSVDDGEDEYAYQAMVKIGGHVFKGFLYDQGIEERDQFPNISDLHLGGGGSGGSGGGRNGAAPPPMIDPSDVYGVSTGAGFLGGGSSTHHYESSFSKLKLLKSYMRSTMSQERLNELTTIAIENDLLEKIKHEDLVVASKKDRKITILK